VNAEDPEEQAKARITAAHYAENADELRTFLNMLGLTPEKKPAPKNTHCTECDAPISRKGIAGYRMMGRDGLCRGCTRRADEATEPRRDYVRTAPPSKRGRNSGECERCGHAMVHWSVAQPGQRLSGGKGLCSPCYHEQRRQPAKAAA
jgi:formylmethanofuran dehydrogenase subunit E